MLSIQYLGAQCRVCGEIKEDLFEKTSESKAEANHQQCIELIRPLEKKIENYIQEVFKDNEVQRIYARLRVQNAITKVCGDQTINEFIKKKWAQQLAKLILKGQQAVDEQVILNKIGEAPLSGKQFEKIKELIEVYCRTYNIDNPYDRSLKSRKVLFIKTKFFKETQLLINQAFIQLRSLESRL
jgi:hypothetical protein